MGTFIRTLKTHTNRSLELNTGKTCFVGLKVGVIVFLLIYLILMDLGNGGGGRHFKCICVGKHMISGAIWNKYARVNFSQTNESAQVRRARILCGL